MKLLIAGNGNLAAAIQGYCHGNNPKTEHIEFYKFKTPQSDLDPYFNDFVSTETKSVVAIHCGSGKQLKALSALCSQWRIPMIQASGNVNIPPEAGISYPYIETPNLALPVICLFDRLKDFVQKFIELGMTIRIIESHQGRKKNTSKTALELADICKVSYQEITSIRDENIQLALGVPAEFLDGHAYHWLIIEGHGVRIPLQIMVNGRFAYAYGAIWLAKIIAGLNHGGSQIGNGKYNATNFLS